MVGEGSGCAYVGGVNLLLLLSALLSALTGVGGSVRQPQVASAVTQQAQAVATATVRRDIAARPAQGRVRLAQRAAAPIAATWVLAAREPIFLSRRRE